MTSMNGDASTTHVATRNLIDQLGEEDPENPNLDSTADVLDFGNEKRQEPQRQTMATENGSTTLTMTVADPDTSNTTHGSTEDVNQPDTSADLHMTDADFDSMFTDAVGENTGDDFDFDFAIDGLDTSGGGADLNNNNNNNTTTTTTTVAVTDEDINSLLPGLESYVNADASATSGEANFDLLELTSPTNAPTMQLPGPANALAMSDMPKPVPSINTTEASTEKAPTVNGGEPGAGENNAEDSVPVDSSFDNMFYNAGDVDMGEAGGDFGEFDESWFENF
jgi:hypothetical protein